MSATDELRRLLDERGVEWHHTSGSLGIPYTWWHSPTMGEVDATEGADGKLYMVLNLDLTPEQAVEATLGSDLEAENAKLRELVRDFYPFASGRAANPWLSVRLERMRELGV